MSSGFTLFTGSYDARAGRARQGHGLPWNSDTFRVSKWGDRRHEDPARRNPFAPSNVDRRGPLQRRGSAKLAKRPVSSPVEPVLARGTNRLVWIAICRADFGAEITECIGKRHF